MLIALKKIGCGFKNFTLVPGGAEQSLQALPHGCIIVDSKDQPVCRNSHRAAPLADRVKQNRAPPPSAFSATIVPPWDSTIERTTASPVPNPLAFVVKNSSNRRSPASSVIPTPYC